MPSAKITTTTPFADYRFRVQAENQQGLSEWSMNSAAAQFNYNKATGGNTEQIKENYNGTGQKWKVHTFTGGGNLVVQSSPWPFKVLVVAGGGGGGYSGNWSFAATYASGAGAGGFYETELEIPTGTHLVTIGQGGAGGRLNVDGATGGASSIGSVISVPGGGGGRSSVCDACNEGPGAAGLAGASGGGARGGTSAGTRAGGSATNSGKYGHKGGDISGVGAGCGGGAGGAGSSSPGPAKSTSIRGNNESFGRGGYRYGGDHSAEPNNTGNGGSAGKSVSAGHKGGSGIVVVAYRIG